MEQPLGNEEPPDHIARAEFVSAYELHAEGLYRYCLRRVGNPGVAQDISQRVFAEAWDRWSDISSPARPITPWLYTVARNMLSGQRRDCHRTERLLRSLGELHPGYAVDPCEEVARGDAARALVGTLRSLPDGQRQ